MTFADALAGPAPASTRWIPVADATALRQAAFERIVDGARRAVERSGSFSIVLAGGNTPRGVYELLRAAPTDWSRWYVYFGDERCLPVDDAKRNNRMAASAWLDHAPIPRDQIHIIPAELGAERSALRYAATLKRLGDVDLVLLGLGEDGRTASLFPGHDWGTARDSPDVLAVFDAPKPPRQRVSLSAARLSRAREVLFLVEGESKREAVRRWKAGADIPARSICPVAGIDVLVEARLLCASGD